MNNRKPASSIITHFWLIWLAFLAASSTAALAEQPQGVGQFTRGDGTTLRAVEMDIDGVVGFIGFHCWLELPGGKEIRVPRMPFDEAGSCVVRTDDAGADIYNFPYSSRWFPVANRVLRFDGHRFTQAAPWKYWVSPFVHTIHYFKGYLEYLGLFTPFLIFGVWLVKKTSARRWWWILLRVIWILIGLYITLALAVLLTAYGPHALGIWFLLVAIYVALYLMLRRFLVMSMKRSS